MEQTLLPGRVWSAAERRDEKGPALPSGLVRGLRSHSRVCILYCRWCTLPPLHRQSKPGSPFCVRHNADNHLLAQPSRHPMFASRFPVPSSFSLIHCCTQIYRSESHESQALFNLENILADPLTLSSFRVMYELRNIEEVHNDNQRQELNGGSDTGRQVSQAAAYLPGSCRRRRQGSLPTGRRSGIQE